MVRIKMFSHYNRFLSHWAKPGEPYIPCYNDSFVRQENIEPNAIALLIEPRPLQPKVYEYIEKNYNRFIYVFTHDSILMDKIPNARLIIWGGVWSWGDGVKDYNKPISMVASWKEEAPVRIQRKHLAMELKDKIDCFGDFDGGPRADTNEIYGKYLFSVVIENHIDEYWITEKICNCFAHFTVPIYYGATNIGELFNTDGIIICHSINEVRQQVDDLLSIGDSFLDYSGRRDNWMHEYFKRQQAIRDNHERVKNYKSFDEWFFKHYETMLEGLQ